MAVQGEFESINKKKFQASKVQYHVDRLFKIKYPFGYPKP